jgi:hypothetical protein
MSLNRFSNFKIFLVIFAIIITFIGIYGHYLPRAKNVSSRTLIIEDLDIAPDGQGMAIEAVDVDTESHMLFVVNEKSNPSVMSIMDARCAAWSPDGSAVAYSKKVPNNFLI